MKRALSITVLLFTFTIICALFWYSDWKYSLPTPVPSQYHAVQAGSHISLPENLRTKNNVPLFLHFFNPDCPCSRFNIPHFKEMAEAYAGKINFAVVVMTKDKSYTADAIREKYGLSFPVLFDSAIAVSCGVYSTPQAVLLTADQTLYYRGNYNRARYCTDKKSNFAQIAIDSLLAEKPRPIFNQFALTAYGCSLPSCTR